MIQPTDRNAFAHLAAVKFGVLKPQGLGNSQGYFTIGVLLSTACDAKAARWGCNITTDHRLDKTKFSKIQHMVGWDWRA